MSSTVEKISERALQQVELALTRLVGAEASLSLRSATLIRDEDFCSRLRDGHVVVRFDFEGGGEGMGVLVVSRKNAIRLAGKLLMAPRAELNRSVHSEDYDDDYRYAYDEIVKCVISAFMRSLRQNSHHCAAVRCGRQEIISGRGSTSLLAALRSSRDYFLVTAALTLAGVREDDILLLLPAFMVVCAPDLGLDGPPDAPEQMDPRSESRPMRNENPPAINPLADLGALSESAFFEELMQRWIAEVNCDLSATFGIQVELAGRPRQAVDAEQIWSCAAGNRIFLTAYRVDGLVSGTIGVAGLIGEAVRIGAMIAGKAVSDDADGRGERLDSDCEDGFHELCSIILAIGAEWLSQLTSEPLSISRQRSVLTTPHAGSASPVLLLEDQDFVMTTLKIAGVAYHAGYLHILFPSLLAEQLELVVQDPGRMRLQDGSMVERGSAGAPPPGFGSVTGRQAPVDGSILLVNASPHDLRPLCDALEKEHLDYEQIASVSELLRERLNGAYACVLLVVDKADEIALSSVIKIKTCCEKPLVVAASQWTQSQVVKALRYGAADILLTPASGRELRDKLKLCREHRSG